MPLTKLQLEKKRSVTWARRRDIPLAILGWFAVFAVIILVFSHIGHVLFLFSIAAIFAYALTPGVTFIERFMPRWLAITLVYFVVSSVLGYVFYSVFEVSVKQFSILVDTLQDLLVPKAHETTSPLIQSLQRLGFSEQQIFEAGRQVAAQLEHVTSSIFPFIQGLFTSIIDILVVAIISIYLLLDGGRLIQWIQQNMPRSRRIYLRFTLHTLQRIVGGYIRGQFLLSLSIGLLVGLGMFLFQLPFAVLLGLLAFLLSFVPIIGTFISGAACVIIALTKGWVIAVLVLGYFIVVHIIEGDILGPRIVGRAVGLHPIISILAVIAGYELLGILGSFLAAPVAGTVQAMLVAVWTEWKDTHPKEFSKSKRKLIKDVNNLIPAETQRK